MQLTTLQYIILFSLIGSVASLTGGLLLLANRPFAKRFSHALAAFAAGALLATAFLHLLPEAVEAVDEPHDVFLWALGGMVLFFLLERIVHGLHPHHEHQEEHNHESRLTVPFLLVGDTVHNFIDGVIIAASFLVSIPLGILTALTVAAHEIPQEIGDFAIMLHRGLSTRRIILYNLLSALAALVGAVLMYALGSTLEAALPVFLSVTAGFFLYIAASDLLPELHHNHRRSAIVLDSLLLLAGIAVVWASVAVLHG